MADLTLGKYSWGLDVLPLFNFLQLTHLNLDLRNKGDIVSASMLATLINLEYLVLGSSMITITTKVLDTLSTLPKLRSFTSLGKLTCQANDVYRFVDSIMTLEHLKLRADWSFSDRMILLAIEDILNGRGGYISQDSFGSKSSYSGYEYSNDDSGSMSLDFSDGDSIGASGGQASDVEEWDTNEEE